MVLYSSIVKFVTGSCTKEFRELGYFPNNTHLNFNYFLSVFGKKYSFFTQVYMLCHNKVLPKTVFWERKNINQYYSIPFMRKWPTMPYFSFEEKKMWNCIDPSYCETKFYFSIFLKMEIPLFLCCWTCIHYLFVYFFFKL